MRSARSASKRSPVRKRARAWDAPIFPITAAAYAQALETADSKGVDIAGGASTVRQALNAGVIDELTLDIAPVLLGTGERTFAEMARELFDFVVVDALIVAPHSLTARALALATVPGKALQWRPKPGEWSAHEVVCHCADAETVAAALSYGLVAIGSAAALGVAVWRFCAANPWPLSVRGSFYAKHLLAASIYALAWILAMYVGDAAIDRKPVIELLRQGVNSTVIGWQFLMGVWLYGLVAGVSYGIQTRQHANESEPMRETRPLRPLFENLMATTTLPGKSAGGLDRTRFNQRNCGATMLQSIRDQNAGQYGPVMRFQIANFS